MKIYDWKRFTTFISILLIFILIILHSCSKKELVIKETQEYKVQSGETLWNIGTKYRPKGMSIQEYIYNLQKFNNIDSMIYPEQEIQILVYEEV